MTKAFSPPAPATVPPATARPYHHGDLRRALIDAARTIIERDGAQAISLRGVAREAGVSPAAPYHHFKDKQELLRAVGVQGFDDLAISMMRALEKVPADPRARLREIGVSYVLFALANPAIYRIMYDCARDMEGLPQDPHEKEHNAYDLVRETVAAAGLADPQNPAGVETVTIACWCAAHGVAEMVGFPQFAPLRDALGGEVPLIRELLRHVGFAAER